MPVSLVDLFPASALLANLEAVDKKSAIKAMVQQMVDRGILQEDAGKKAEKAILKRESQGSTGIGKGLAIPHAKGCSFVDNIVGLFARSSVGVPFDAVDGSPVHVFFMVLSPEDQLDDHVHVMKRIAKLLFDEKTLKYLATDEELANVEEIFREVDEHAG